MSQNLRKQITENIIKTIESNRLLPWRQPWSGSPNSGRPKNAQTGAAYRGINPILLDLHAQNLGFTSRYWATYRQWESLGCQVERRPANVPRGQWGCSVVFFKSIKKPVVAQDTGVEENEEFLLMRSYTVFNADQVTGADPWRVQEEPLEVVNYQPADDLIAATGATIYHKGDRAFYRRPTPEGSWPNHNDGDFIVLPRKNLFENAGAYYETAFHELAHFSEVRLGWDHNQHGYSMGELVAEIAACYISREIGLPVGETIGNHASYLKSWLEGMKADTSFIFRASTQASKVTDYLLSYQKESVVESVMS